MTSQIKNDNEAGNEKKMKSERNKKEEEERERDVELTYLSS